MSDEPDLIEAEAGAAPEPAETDAAAPASTDAAPAPAPDWSSPEFNQQVETRVMQVLEELAGQQPQQQPQDPQHGFELDPFDPNYTQQMQEMVRSEAQRMFAEQFGQFQPAIQHAQQEWAENWVNGTLDQLGVTDPQLREEVVYATPGFLQAANGNPQAAMAQAAQWAKSRDEQKKAVWLEEYKQSLGVQTPPGAPAGGGAAGLEIQEQPHTYEEVLARYTSEHSV